LTAVVAPRNASFAPRYFSSSGFCSRSLKPAAAAAAATTAVGSSLSVQPVRAAAAAAAMSTAAPKKEKGAAQFGDVSSRYVTSVPKGEKKDFAAPMADAYDPSVVESTWDAFWEAHDLYKPDETKDEKFVIVIPPPNVTGSLHLGHALTVAIQDSVVRRHRMLGKAALWVPGLDHAGIATQVVVEKQLARTEGKSRHDIGREAFVDAVWQWKEQYGSRIDTQIRAVGASVDWSRYRFTMDETCAAAVQKAFTVMHERGLIYRANRIVSWSCALRSAISSIEVDHLDVEGSTMVSVPGFPRKVEVGVIHSFAYKVLADDGVTPTDEEIVVATTRIETMLGDVAVAVYPGDARYKHLVGRRLAHPFIADRIVTVVEDAVLVKPEFGTGAVKITPAHDPNDFLCGERNGLPRINILDDRGYLNSNAGGYAGQHRYEARERVIADLEAAGLYRGKADNPMSIGLCSRSKDIVEPIIRPQWWVKCDDMAKRAADAARSKDLAIVPSQFEQVWYRWLDNIQDWCISRQLWWGHRIPAFYARRAGADASAEEEDINRWVIAPTEAEARTIAEQRFPGEELILEQDPDVLDTWFSSGLFPFSVMGWPNEQSTDLARYFPGHLLETGSDILFFWVARMVMMSLELTGKLPFNTVYLHTLVRDRVGRKMSKSLGNVIDPLHVVYGITLEELQKTLENGNLEATEVAKAQANQAADFPAGIPQCGADALRFGLLSYTRQGTDINLDPNRLVIARTFCNKMWQATRFALKNFPADFAAPESLDQLNAHMAAAGGASTAQAWILSRLHHANTVVDAAFTNYVFGDATEAVQTFFVDELCSRYLEMIKPILRDDALTTEAGKLSAQSHLSTLFYCLDLILRILHPMMPFVTEELWHRLPGHEARVAARVAAAGGAANADKRVLAGSIMIAEYPTPAATASLASPEAEAGMAVIDSLVAALRSTKNSVGLKNSQRPDVYVIAKDPATVALVAKEAGNVATLAFLGTVAAVSDADAAATVPKGCMSVVVSGGISAAVVVEGLVDIAAEVVKSERKHKDLRAQQDALEAVMNGPAYANCKPEVKVKNTEKHASNDAELASLQAAIDNFSALVSRKQYLPLKIADVDTDVAKVVKNLEKNGCKEADVNAPAPAEPEADADAPKKKPSKAELAVASLRVQYNALVEQREALKAELAAL
jgi:valyl-tRNA synthetase